MRNFISSIEAIINWITPATWVIVAAALIITGVMMAVGGEEGKEKAKKRLPWIAVGAIIILGALTLGRELVRNITF